MSNISSVEKSCGLPVYKMIIDGSPVEGRGSRFSCTNPYDGSTWAHITGASEADVDQAIAAARRAFEDSAWSRMFPAGRAALLRRLGDVIEKHAEALSDTQVRENGKLTRETLPQTRGVAGHCRFFAGLAETVHGQTIPISVPNMSVFTTREPIGVIAAIAPWNSPLSLLLWKLCPALAVGNTVVIKPSEVTTVSTLELVELFEEAGFPPGVVNVVTGKGDVGAALAAHPGIDKVAFTGSPNAGAAVGKAAAANFTRVTLELGGKSANIVFADADIDNAVNGIIAGVFAAAGQTCMAGSRVLLEDSIYDKVAERLAARVKAIKLGDPTAPDTEMGPIACQSQYDKVQYYFGVAEEDGATLLAGGTLPAASLELPKEGLFVLPTIYGDVTQAMRIAQEEVFGPFAVLMRFTDEDDAVRIANSTRFGLAAGIWTNNLQRAHRMIPRLRAGSVWVNTYRKTNYVAPFGGYGHSGIGRENGADSINEYTEVKCAWIDTGNVIEDPFDPRKFRS